MRIVCHDMQISALHVAPYFLAVIPHVIFKLLTSSVILPATLGPAILQVIQSHEWPSRALRIELVIRAVPYVDLEVLEVLFLLRISKGRRSIENILYQKKSVNEVGLLKIKAHDEQVIKRQQFTSVSCIARVVISRLVILGDQCFHVLASTSSSKVHDKVFNWTGQVIARRCANRNFTLELHEQVRCLVKSNFIDFVGVVYVITFLCWSISSQSDITPCTGATKHLKPCVVDIARAIDHPCGGHRPAIIAGPNVRC